MCWICARGSYHNTSRVTLVHDPLNEIPCAYLGADRSYGTRLHIWVCELPVFTLPVFTFGSANSHYQYYSHSTVVCEFSHLEKTRCFRNCIKGSDSSGVNFRMSFTSFTVSIAAVRCSCRCEIAVENLSARRIILTSPSWRWIICFIIGCSCPIIGCCFCATTWIDSCRLLCNLDWSSKTDLRSSPAFLFMLLPLFVEVWKL